MIGFIRGMLILLVGIVLLAYFTNKSIISKSEFWLRALVGCLCGQAIDTIVMKIVGLIKRVLDFIPMVPEILQTIIDYSLLLAIMLILSKIVLEPFASVDLTTFSHQMGLFVIFAVAGAVMGVVWCIVSGAFSISFGVVSTLLAKIATCADIVLKLIGAALFASNVKQDTMAR